MADKQPTGKRILGAAEIQRSLVRIAHEIVERNRGVDDVLLLGIPSGGVPLTEEAALSGCRPPAASVPVGTLDITMFRDDLGRHPIRVPQPTRIPGGTLEGRTVILVDDVLYSGRTIRAALDALGSVGRADAVQLAVLVDRGHRELPIRADYVGKNLPTSRTETVVVSLTELGAPADAVTIHDVTGARDEEAAR